MQLAAIAHHLTAAQVERLSDTDVILRLQTGRDVKRVDVVFGDPYTLYFEKWFVIPQNMQPTYTTALHQYWETQVTIATHRLSYGFIVTGQDDTQVFVGEQGIQLLETTDLTADHIYFRLPFLHQNEVIQTPDWVKDTIWYQIFPERFANGAVANDPAHVQPWDSEISPSPTDYYGGDLAGIIDHLDDLQALGINGLYLTPIFESPSNHKYDTVDYFKIDRHFGDEQTLKKLITAAHQRGMRVMLDAVFNHIGAQSPMWQDVLQKGEASPYAQWFHVHEFPVVGGQRPNFDTFAFTDQMPKWRTDNPDVKQYLLSVATYWLTEFDIDAWRLDVANEVDHAFWREFRQVVKAVKPDVYILGEIWHDATPWLQGDEFDGVMNYAGMTPILSYFIDRQETLTDFVYEMNRQFVRYPQRILPMLFNLLDSHDTPRILTRAKGHVARFQQAMVMMFLQKGTPNIYYGTEYGLIGNGDPDNRRAMPWHSAQQNQAIYQFMQQLIAFRKTYSEMLIHEPIIWQEVTDETGLLRFNIGTLQMTFNTGTTDVMVNVTEDILLAQALTGDILSPDGFVIARIL